MLHHDSERNPFTGISPELADHLRSEVYEELGELGELEHAIHSLTGKAMRRQRRIKQHMMHCGECLSEQIKSGMLIELSDYWQLQEQSGGGKFPKIHYQGN